jgi:hypothetical protein
LLVIWEKNSKQTRNIKYSSLFYSGVSIKKKYCPYFEFGEPNKPATK